MGFSPISGPRSGQLTPSSVIKTFLGRPAASMRPRKSSATADLVVIVTDHDDFDWDEVSRCPPSFDTRRQLRRKDNVEHL